MIDLDKPVFIHPKNRDCARTEEVLANYKRRALAAELELVRHGLPIPPKPKDEDND